MGSIYSIQGNRNIIDYDAKERRTRKARETRDLNGRHGREGSGGAVDRNVEPGRVGHLDKRNSAWGSPQSGEG